MTRPEEDEGGSPQLSQKAEADRDVWMAGRDIIFVADPSVLPAPGSGKSSAFALWKKVLDRPAFRTPCVMELFISELASAIDDTQAAFNTGRLYSRNGNLLAELSPSWTAQGAGVVRMIVTRLTQLKAAVTRFQYDFHQANPQYAHHENFFAMLSSLNSRYSAQDGRYKLALLRQMDEIDQSRNEIITLFNSLAGQADEPLPLIELSSDTARQGIPWLLE
jgi:hypothetical protein